MHGLNKNITILKNKDGFTLIELLVVMVVFVVVIAISADTFKVIARQSAQQVKMSETQIEDIVGLELLRTDIEHAGYGLPWNYSETLAGYSEATSPATAVNYNDTAATVPRPILSGNDMAAYLNQSDYLVIKSTVAGMNAQSQRWSYFIDDAGARQTWTTDNLDPTDRVVIIRPAAGATAQRRLATNGGAFSPQYAAFAGFPVQADDLIYGIIADATSTTPIRVPFNRTDYYISRPADISTSCAPNTGVLYKTTLNHGDGAFREYPLLDCVADFQIIYRLDMDEDGTVGTSSNADGSGVSSSEGIVDVPATFLSADLIRSRLKEVRVYILIHEGQRDPDFNYPTNTVTVGDATLGLGGAVKIFDLAAIIGGNWQNYRWKVIQLVVKPKNLS